jgi:hypothetical protein
MGGVPTGGCSGSLAHGSTIFGALAAGGPAHVADLEVAFAVEAI